MGENMEISVVLMTRLGGPATLAKIEDGLKIIENFT